MKMIEEKLIKEATSTTAWRCITMIDRPLFVRGYIMGAEPREKQIEELENRLTKAKEIIKDYMVIVTGDHTTVCSVPEENRCINVSKLNEQAEQFSKEK